MNSRNKNKKITKKTNPKDDDCKLDFQKVTKSPTDRQKIRNRCLKATQQILIKLIINRKKTDQTLEIP